MTPMDYEEHDDISTSDSVQWQASQTPCAALDSLLSEATCRSYPDVFNNFGRESTNRASSSRSNVIASGSNWPHNGETRSARSSTLNTPDSAPNWNNSTTDHRTRQSRPSSSSSTATHPVGDPEQFLNMLKGISQRIDGNIRSDAGVSKDNNRRRPPSKRLASGPGSGVKRVRHAVVSESSNKGKGRDSGAWSCTSTNTDPLGGSSVGRPKSRNGLTGRGIADAMEVDSPRPSYEIMPPPPVPLMKAKSLISESVVLHDTIRISRPISPVAPPAEVMNRNVVPTASGPSSQPKPTPQRDHPSSTPASSAPASTPKLHPLLETERKQRRLKLERAISASLASSPAQPSSTSKPLSCTKSTIAPPAHQRQQPPRPQSNHHDPDSLPLSQNRAVGNASRLPPLGMRRTHTFPSILNKPQAAGVVTKPPLLPSQRSFKPPLLPSSQTPSTQSTTSSSRSTVPSSHSSELTYSSKTSPLTSIDTPGSMSGDQDMEDSPPPSSEADISFGDAISLDVDMDALEATMRKYD